jgi:hypothetical protein
MLNKHNTKKILQTAVNAEYINAFNDIGKLKSTLFRVLSPDANSMLEKKCLSKMIESHIAESRHEKAAPLLIDPFSSGSLDDMASAFKSLADMHTSEADDAFKGVFVEKMVDSINGKLRDANAERLRILIEYMSNMGITERASLETLDFQQVEYRENQDYCIQHDNYTVLEDSGAHKLFEQVLTNGIKPNDVRLLGGKRIAIDFENIGYHANVNGDMSPLIAISETIDALREEYSSVSNSLYEHNAIEFVLCEIAKEITLFYGKEVADSMRLSGEDLHDLYYAQMTNTSETAVIGAAEEVCSILKCGPFGELIHEHASQCMTSVGTSIQDVIQWKKMTLENRYKVDIDFDLISEEFDGRVKTAMDLKEGNDMVGFKRQYNSLGPLERIAVDLELSSKHGAEKPPERQVPDNVVSLF